MHSVTALLFLALITLSSPSITASPATRDATMYAGNLRVDIATGRVDGQVCTSKRPSGFADAFVLNVGLNVVSVTDGDGHPVSYDGWAEPTIDGEARVYAVAEAPATLCVRYVGAFAVYPGHDAPGDFKGLMAFNGDSFRFSEQSAWLPMPYDAKAQVRQDDGTYELDVVCDACRFIYITGSEATVGTKAHFHSDVPRPMLVFGGTGPITKTANATILNETVQDAEANAISDLVGKIKNYYQGYLGKPMTDRPTFLRMVTVDQIQRDRRGGEWAFATWPTLAFSGSVGKTGTIMLQGGKPASGRVAYLAHEMGHYYFGTMLRPQGLYRWFLLESTAEFLSMKAQRAISGDEAADRHIAGWRTQVEKQQEPFTALDRIASISNIGETYRYSYGPLLLLSLEKRVGERKMQAFLRQLLATPPLMTWTDLGKVAGKAGIDAQAWQRWTDECIANGTSACRE